MRLPMLAGLVSLVLVVLASPAAAHLEFAGHYPPTAAELDTAPRQIILRAGAAYDPAGTHIQILDEGWRIVPEVEVTFQQNDRTLVARPYGPLPPGGYTVVWTAQSAADGHVSTGSWAFSVAAPATAAPTAPPVPSSALGLRLIGETTALVGLSLVVGVLILRVLGRTAGESRHGLHTRPLVAAVGVHVAGLVMALVATAWMAIATASDVGALDTLLRLVVALVMLAVLDPWPQAEKRYEVVTLSTLVVVQSLLLAGTGPWRGDLGGELVLLGHIILIIAWIGSVVVLVERHRFGENGHGGKTDRFLVWTGLVALLVVLTGAWSLASAEGATQKALAWSLGTFLVLVGAMAAWLVSLRGASLRAPPRGLVEGGALGAIVLLLFAATALSPGAATAVAEEMPEGPAFTATGTEFVYEIHFEAPLKAGQVNNVTVRALWPDDGTVATEGRFVSFAAVPIGRDIPPLSHVPVMTTDGRSHVDPFLIPAAGEWELRVAYRDPFVYLDEATVTVTVA